MNKKHFFLILLLLSFFISCEIEQPNFISYEVYDWKDLDVKGGSWKPVLTNLDPSIIAAPVSTSDAAYITELAEVEKKTSEITSQQKDIAAYWSNNPAIRWNEIARELAAKYNLAPGANSDGSYSVPNPAMPDVYPYFPFCHPPYAARMFSYLSVAQYDALIGVWALKFQYNRPALSITRKKDGLLKDMSLPSYPSDGAAISQIAVTVLSAMFPLEKDYLNQKANEHFESLVYSGLNTSSDIEAGKKIGLFYAQKTMARAGTDGMKNAQASKAIGDSIKNLAQTTFGWSFQNLEIPERKVGLVPYYGKVKTWAVVNVAALRAPIPPKPGSAEYKKAEQELIDIAKNMTKEQRKIAFFWADGTNTYTPPGHWNRIACDEIVYAKSNPLRTVRTLAYTNMAIMDAGIVCWDTKYYYHYPRPNQIIPNFKTLLGTPNFPGYTSGHSTFSAAAATTLAYIFPASSQDFAKYAKEASESRIYGGIHFRFDSEEGLIAGQKVGNEVINLASKDGAQ
jgi:membrane-associated phospholipid phosphatase